MDDLSATISQVLSDPEKVRQIQSIAASLGLGGPEGERSVPKNPQSEPPPSSGGGLDLSALNGLLGSLGGRLGGGNTTPQIPLQNNNGSGFDVGGLAGLLRSGNPDGGASGSGGFDMGVLLKLQQAMANLSVNRSNIDLLVALKPRLSEPRAKKIDDAIRVMQIVQFLPLLKETGLFGQMDSILGGLGGSSGGVGNLLGNLLGGGAGLLGNLIGRK
jgi:hypothetical protein